MIIAFPNDGSGNEYHVLNLLGQTVHAYRDAYAALRGVGDSDATVALKMKDGSMLDITDSVRNGTFKP
jgi:hypothetical protein